MTTGYYPKGDYQLTPRNHMRYRESASHFLKYDQEGKLIETFEIKPYFICFHISKEGYVLGKHPYSDAEELAIYKFINH